MVIVIFFFAVLPAYYEPAPGWLYVSNLAGASGVSYHARIFRSQLTDVRNKGELYLGTQKLVTNNYFVSFIAEWEIGLVKTTSQQT